MRSLKILLVLCLFALVPGCSTTMTASDYLRIAELSAKGAGDLAVGICYEATQDPDEQARCARISKLAGKTVANGLAIGAAATAPATGTTTP